MSLFDPAEVEEFKREYRAKKKINPTLKKFEDTVPKEIKGLVYGSAKGLLGYIASGAKLLGKKELQKRANEAKHKLEDRIKDVPYWALAGEIVGDPLNLTPAGVVSKGSKLARVAKSGLLGAGVGYTSMKAKNYGDDRLTNKQKEAQNVLSGSVSGLINMGIAGVTRGKISSADEIVQKINEKKLNPTDDVIVSKIKADDFKLGEIAKSYEQQKQPDKIVGGDYIIKKPEIVEAKLEVDPNRHTKYIPNWQFVPTNLPVVANEQKSFKDMYIDNLLKTDDAKEVLELAKDRSYKDIKSPNIRITKRKIINENSGDGWKSSVIKELDVENPEYDFMLTKSDVKKINSGKIDEKILDKLYNDITVLRHQKEANNFDEIMRYFYQKEYPDIDFSEKPKDLSYDDWVEANRVFANTGSNLAVGVGAGSINAVDTAMDGGNSEDIQSSFLKGLLLGAGGSKALSHLSPRYRKLISPKFDGNVLGANVGHPNKTKLYSNYLPIKKGLDVLDKAGSKAIGGIGYLVDKATGHKLSETIKKIKDSDEWNYLIKTSKLEKNSNYMNSREKLFRDLQNRQTTYEVLHTQLKNLSEHSKKALYDYFNGNDETIEHLSDKIKEFANDFRELINIKSKELTDLGVLDDSLVKVWKNRYLKRSYSKHLMPFIAELYRGQRKTLDNIFARGKEWIGSKEELEKYQKEGKLGSFFDGKISYTILPNGKVKFRQDFDKVTRTRWGEIKDIAYALPNTLAYIDTQILHARFLKEVADKSGSMLTKDKLKEILKKKLSNDARFKGVKPDLSSIDEINDWKSLEDMITPEYLRALGYKKVYGKKWGALNNRWIKEEVARDINNIRRDLEGFEKKILEAIKRTVSYWKATKTIYSPVTHLNNLLSNVTMQFMDGESISNAINNAIIGTKQYYNYKRYLELKAKELTGLNANEKNELKTLMDNKNFKLFLEGKNNGLFGRSSLNDILYDYVLNLKNSHLQKMHSIAKKLYAGEDDVMRYSLYKSLRDRGFSIDEAIKKVNSVIPDYSKPITPAGDYARKLGIIPFYSWIYYATPILLRQVKEHPARLLAIYSGIYAFYANKNLDIFNKEQVPEKFTWDRIPIIKEGNKIEWLKVDKWIPHWGIVNLPDDMQNMFLSSPFIGTMLNANNLHPYYKNKITWAKDGSLKYYADLSETHFKNWTPQIVGSIYDIAKTKLVPKKKRRKNHYIEPRNNLESLAKLLGVNLITTDQEKLKEFTKKTAL